MRCVWTCVCVCGVCVWGVCGGVWEVCDCECGLRVGLRVLWLNTSLLIGWRRLWVTLQCCCCWCLLCGYRVYVCVGCSMVSYWNGVTIALGVLGEDGLRYYSRLCSMVV